MHAEVIPEPELEFGGGGRHIDPRFGIANYGPADLAALDAPRAIRIGLIGPADQLPGIRAWFERCREPIAAKDERYPHLFPGFPGCDIDRGLHIILVFSDRHTRALGDRDLRLITDAPAARALATAIEVYAAEITAMAEENRVDVFLVARPPVRDEPLTERVRYPSPMSANSFAVSSSQRATSARAVLTWLIWSSDELRRVAVSAREGGAGVFPGCR